MWLVWRPGSPDPSRPRAAIHHDDPAKDRDRGGRLAEIPIAPVHFGMSIRQLLTIDAYNLPKSARTSIDGDTTKVVGDGGKRVLATIEA
jgi:hypothetical protein